MSEVVAPPARPTVIAQDGVRRTLGDDAGQSSRELPGALTIAPHVLELGDDLGPLGGADHVDGRGVRKTRKRCADCAWLVLAGKRRRDSGRSDPVLLLFIS